LQLAAAATTTSLYKSVALIMINDSSFEKLIAFIAVAVLSVRFLIMQFFYFFSFCFFLIEVSFFYKKRNETVTDQIFRQLLLLCCC